ncbi:MAG TPA: hypothetical protein VGF29_08485, partial [Hyphomicrobiaceae bacterium]
MDLLARGSELARLAGKQAASLVRNAGAHVVRIGTPARAALTASLRSGPLDPAAQRVERWLEARRQAPEGRYRIELATPRSRTFAAAGIVLMVVLVALPAVGSRSLINELIFVLTMLALAQYWNLLAGYA